jgi:TP901 family phage tail tape measure protein
MALSVGELFAYLKLDSTQFNSGVRVARGEMKSATGSAETLSRAVAGTQRSLANAGRTTDVAAKGTARLRAAQLSAVAATEKYDAALRRQGATAGQIATAEARLVRANEAVRASMVAAGVGASTTAGRFAKMRTSLVEGIASTGKMALGLGAGLGAFELIKKSIDIGHEAAQFQSSMQRIGTVVGTSDAEIRQLSAGLLTMSGKVAKAPDELATSLYHMKAVGLPAAKALNAVEVAAKGSQIGNADLEETTNALTSTIASGIVPNQSYAKTMSQLLTIVGTGDMKLSDFNESLSSGLMATMASSGVSLRDMGAALAVFGDNNIRGANAATMLTTAVQAMQAPAKGGAATLDMLGLKSGQLKDDLQSGGLNKAVSDLRDHLRAAGITSEETGAYIVDAFGKRANKGITQLVAHFDFLQTKYAAIDDVSATLGKRWDKLTHTTSFELDRLGAQANAAGVSIAMKLTPAVGAAAAWLSTNLPKAIGTAQSILKPFETFVGGALVAAWNAFTAVMRVTGEVLGPVVRLIEDIKGPLADVAEIALGAWAAFKGAEAVGALVAGVITWLRALPAAAVSMASGVKSSVTGYVTSLGLITPAAEEAAAGSSVAMNAMADEAALMSGEVGVSAKEYAASMALIAESSTAAADTVVVEGEVATVGWAGLLGPLAAVGVGVGLLVSMFHKSGNASKEAAEAAKAYTDALKSTSGANDTTTILDAIETQLNKNDIPAKIKIINTALASTKQISGSDFVKAIQTGRAPLANLRSQLEAVVKAGTEFKETTVGAMAQNVKGGWTLTKQAKAAKEALESLNIEHGKLSAAEQKDFDDTQAYTKHASAIQKVALATKVGTPLLKQYATMMGIVVDDNGIAAVSQAALGKAVDTVSTAYTRATATGSEYLAAVNSFATSAGASADRAALISATLKAGNGDALAYAGAMATAGDAVRAVGSDLKSAAATAFPKLSKTTAGAHEALVRYTAGLVNLKTGTINYTRAGAGPLIQDLQSVQTSALAAASATYQHARATMNGKDAADAAYKVYQTQTRTALKGEASALGVTTTQAGKLADKYFGMPKKVKTLIEQEGSDPVLSVLNKIGALLANLTGQKWTTDVDLNPSTAQDKIAVLQTQIDNIQQGLVPTVDTDTLEGREKVAELQREIDQLKGKSVQVEVQTVNTSTTPGQKHPGAKGNATGGKISGPGTGTSDSVLRRLSNGEYVSTAKSTSRNERALAAGNAGAMLTATFANGRQVTGLAKGGKVTTATVYRVGGGYGFMGNYYGGKDALKDANTARADYLHNRAAAAKYQDPAEARQAAQQRRSTARGNAASAANITVGIDPPTVSALTTFKAQLNNALGKMRAAIRAGVDPKSLKGIRHELAAEVKAANNQLGRLRVKVDGADMRALKSSLKGTASDARSAFQAMLADARSAGLSASAAAAATKTAGKIYSHINTRNALQARLGEKPTSTTTAYDRLATAKANLASERDTVKSAVTGFFNVSSAGTDPNGNDTDVSFARMQAGQTQAKNQIKKWADGIKTLSGTFGKSKAGQSYLKSLAEAGPSSLPQVNALLDASPGDLAAFVATETDIETTAASIGGTVGTSIFGASVTAAAAAVTHLQNLIAAQNDTIQKLDTKIETGISQGLDGLKIVIDDKGVARLVTRGHNKNNRRS